jgi:hypothetical protein
LFGGYRGQHTSADTWEWDGITWTELHPASSPSPRGTAAAAYDRAHHEVVLFGGYDDNATKLTDTWVWDGTTWTQRMPASAPPSSLAVMAWDDGGQQIVLFSLDSGTT